MRPYNIAYYDGDDDDDDDENYDLNDDDDGQEATKTSRAAARARFLHKTSKRRRVINIRTLFFPSGGNISYTTAARAHLLYETGSRCSGSYILSPRAPKNEQDCSESSESTFII